MMKENTVNDVELNEDEVYEPETKADLKEVTPKQKKKHKGLRFLVIGLATIGFVLYAAITIINQNVQISQKKTELKDLNEQINVVEIQAEYYAKVQNYQGDELNKYMEKIAKEDLGYVSEGERIFINVDGE